MKLMLTLAALGMVTMLCGAYDGWQDGGSHDGKPGGDHKPDKDIKGDSYHDWLSPWDGNAKDQWHNWDYSTKVYTYPVYYYYSTPYYYSYPYYSWYYAPQYYDQWWDPWWATNVYGVGGVKYSFKSGWGYQSGFGFGDP
jgi:hypothetical protein